MLVSVPVARTTVKLVKVMCRTRYDIPGYTGGGLPYAYKDTKGDGYLVTTPEGKPLGKVFKWADGEWTASKISTSVTLPDDERGPLFVFGATLYAAKTRAAAIEKLVRVSSNPDY